MKWRKGVKPSLPDKLTDDKESPFRHRWENGR